MIPLVTARLTLRRLSPDDAPFILALLNEPSFVRHIGDRGVRTIADAESYIAAGPLASYERFGFGLYLVQLTHSAAPIGICGLVKRDTLPDVDIGFAFLPRFWSQGYAFESACAVRDHARDEVGLRRLVAIVDPVNAGSIRVLEKLGFTFEKMVRLGDEHKDLKLFGCDLSQPRAIAKRGER
jgi:RimJ/RimL family protein N-acetyltransferase